MITREDLTTKQAKALVVLQSIGPLTASQVGRVIGSERHAARTVLLALNKRGLVRRVEQGANPTRWEAV